MADDTIKGMTSLLAKIDGLKNAAPKAVGAALQLGAFKVQENALKSIQSGDKHGRVYMKGKHGTIRHVASAPGEAPAQDTGNLARSIFVGLDQEALVATITVKANYATALEFGTNRMAPRPFMGPALKAATPFIVDQVTKAVQDSIKQ